MDWLLATLSFLYGTIPFSYIVGKLWGVDITKTGSRNVGASNVGLSTGSLAAFLVAFVLDATKGAIPALFGPIYGALGILGHIFALPFAAIKFRGRRWLTGLGMSATIGFLAVRALPMIPLALAAYALFYVLSAPKDIRRWYSEEEGNIATVFAVGFAALLYVTLFRPDWETQVAILIAVAGIFVAYARKIREELMEHWR